MAMNACSYTIIDEHELKPLQKKFEGLPKNLATAACNIDTVLQLAAEARTVPLSEIIPINSSKEGSQALASLKEIRAKFITRVVLFREVLLPVSSDVVNALHSLLDYMEDEEVFLELAKAGEVSVLCNQHAKKAADVQQGYESLSTDLLGLTDEMDAKFQKVQLDIQALVQKNQKHKSMREMMEWAAGGIAVAGVVGGTALALCLLGPGGVLFAPHLAAGAFSACCAGGGGVAMGAKCISGAAETKAVAKHAAAQALHQAHSAAQHQLPSAVKLFAGAMQHLAEFFSLFGSSVQRIERTAARIECIVKQEAVLDRCYTALYKTLRKQMAAVKQSCDDYQRFVSHVHIRVAHLQLGEKQQSLSYIEEWFKEQQEAGVSDNCLAPLLRLKDAAVSATSRAQQRLAGCPTAAQV